MCDTSANVAHVLTERQNARLQEFLRRAEYAQHSFRFCREVEGDHAGFNESLRMIDRGLHQPRRKRRSRKRMHPEVELVLSHFARGFARERTGEPDARPDQSDIQKACEKLLAEIKPLRGRPPDRALQHHGAGLMCLWLWLTGRDVTASTAPSSDYKPQLTSVGAKTIWELLNQVDPGVTKTAVVNIIIEARAEGTLEGKEFRDWFPLYGAKLDSETGSPQLGMCLKLESFELSYPIYSS